MRNFFGGTFAAEGKFGELTGLASCRGVARILPAIWTLPVLNIICAIENGFNTGIPLEDRRIEAPFIQESTVFKGYSAMFNARIYSIY